MTVKAAAWEVRLVDACAARHGWTDRQRAAALTAVAAAPASLPGPTKGTMRGVPTYDVACAAAAAAGAK